MSSKIRKTKELREFSPILLRNGYTYARTRGSHFIYVNRLTGKHISINKDLNREVRSRLIKENNLVQEVNENEVDSDFTKRQICFVTERK